ncbi:MAG TPA: DUF4856 domain-containing protein [Chryseolinea sp.]|nr:DUF4856 domain-containing protein [Chryseolinea sp.]
MIRRFLKPTICLLAAIAIASCDDDDDAKPDLRADLDYATLNHQTDYSEQFTNENGASTVDLTEGNTLHKMFQALNYYSSSNTAANTAISASVLKNMFANSGNPFVDISTATISVTGATLNASGLQLEDATASSKSSSEAQTVLTKLNTEFDNIAQASLSITETAASGKAGKLGTYLVDTKGIEIIQIIQKSLIGALQLDYIGNVLLSQGLDADNHTLVDGKEYSQLEHNWDEAYGLFTLSPAYLYNIVTQTATTNDTRATVEFGAGAYVWEYNKTGYPTIYPAFLKGRAAIVNNDKSEVAAQATIIRTEMEKAIARAALGYLDKWKTGESDGARAHAIGEGLGFIYSLRFATIHPADAAWSDGVINGLVGSANGFWDLDGTKINVASDAIKAKFGIQ